MSLGALIVRPFDKPQSPGLSTAPTRSLSFKGLHLERCKRRGSYGAVDVSRKRFTVRDASFRLHVTPGCY
jgi:hypothetical protein